MGNLWNLVRLGVAPQGDANLFGVGIVRFDIAFELVQIADHLWGLQIMNQHVACSHSSLVRSVKATVVIRVQGLPQSVHFGEHVASLLIVH
jgi:hypothetical protein